MSDSPILPKLDRRDVIALQTIQLSWDTCGYAPTLRVLASAMQTSSTSVSRYRVQTLEARGLLHVPRMAHTGELVAHSMRLTELARQALRLHSEGNS